MTSLPMASPRQRGDTAPPNASGPGRKRSWVRQSRIYATDERFFEEARQPHPRIVALFVWFNFCCQHKAHKLSPAMAAGISDQLWSMEDIVAPGPHCVLGQSRYDGTKSEHNSWTADMPAPSECGVHRRMARNRPVWVLTVSKCRCSF
jgi:hypothetical protein